jgi:hypothetical protein
MKNGGDSEASSGDSRILEAASDFAFLRSGRASWREEEEPADSN